MKIFSFFAANIKYGGGIVSHLPLCLSSIRRSHVILMAGENNLLLVSFILNLSNRIWSTLPKPLPFSRITVLMYFLGVSVSQCLQWNPKLHICRQFWSCSLTPCIIDYVKTAEEYSKNPNHHQCISAHSPFCRGESAKFLHGFKSVLKFDVLLQVIFINVHIAIMVENYIDNFSFFAVKHSYCTIIITI